MVADPEAGVDHRPPVGAPVYDLAGRPVGVTSTQHGSEGGDDSEGSSSRTFLLPLEDATKSLEQAKKHVVEAVAKAAEAKRAPAEKPEAPAPEKPATPSMDEPAPAPTPAPAPAPKEPPK